MKFGYFAVIGADINKSTEIHFGQILECALGDGR
ncbi:MAG: hypothetical protein BWX89_00628 [candidate division TA06 bacterium ADurb.Bin131]|uniref:Uncharacterized protein n=1 Tax=candidate division TA06 bacterium ADurb.Bin131 TaxID=1852827 RepID=A0A1V6CB81_UNCT6|nr:MAG: hypothetical protein BWX89_00628 [candidate division TA06 bacterium ADurb.Bin131]